MPHYQKQLILLILIIMLLFSFIVVEKVFAQNTKGSDAAYAIFKYEDFEKPQACGSSCHIDFYQQWLQMMMSQCYTHHWDEIEYFNLAVPHADKDPKVAEVKAGCNGCHAPVAFLSGDTPPPKPHLKPRANESVSCDVCHTVTGIDGDIPFNFNFISNPGRVKYGNRTGVVSPYHETKKSELLTKGEFCGACHNEKSPYGIWVKSTQLEWKEGPYYKEGIQCQTCHMPVTPGRNSLMGEEHDNIAQHLFHGAHDPGKVKGTVELRIHPDFRESESGEEIKLTVVLFNAKTGHKFPTGSAEERMLWLHVEAVDSKGKIFHLKVDKKGFPGEEYTISSNELAYQDMGIPLNLKDFKGIQRDGIPLGNRIFRMPYFDPQGRMTIMQWNTASLGYDYRFGPRETKIETFKWLIPDNIEPGEVIIKAVLNYQKLPTPVAECLNVPMEEAEIIVVNMHETKIVIE